MPEGNHPNYIVGGFIHGAYFHACTDVVHANVYGSRHDNFHRHYYLHDAGHNNHYNHQSYNRYNGHFNHRIANFYDDHTNAAG